MLHRMEVHMSANVLDRFRLTNRTALVTGARREIGRAIALALSSAGRTNAVTLSRSAMHRVGLLSTLHKVC